MRRLSLVLLAAAFAAAGCTSSQERLELHVDVDTPELRTIRAEAGIDPCPEPAADAATQAPDVVLPCLGGGRDVALRSVAGPAVLNVWAQWCQPCRGELPLFQRLHERAGDRVQVLGIDWQDTQPDGALALADALDITYPHLADPAALVSDGWRVTGLPVTVFVDEQGRTTVHRKPIYSFDELAGLVADHTGVRLRAG